MKCIWTLIVTVEISPNKIETGVLKKKLIFEKRMYFISGKT